MSHVWCLTLLLCLQSCVELAAPWSLQLRPLSDADQAAQPKCAASMPRGASNKKHTAAIRVPRHALNSATAQNTRSQSKNSREHTCYAPAIDTSAQHTTNLSADLHLQTSGSLSLAVEHRTAPAFSAVWVILKRWLVDPARWDCSAQLSISADVRFPGNDLAESFILSLK